MENKGRKFIAFKYWSRLHFVALAVPLCCMLTTYIQKNELKHYNKILQDEKHYSKIKEFPYFFNIFISKILSIILVLISKRISKDKRSSALTQVETKAKRRYHLDVYNTSKKIKTAFLIIGISILELIFKIEGYLTIGKPNYIELKLGFILLVPILSLLILKKQLYRHHYLCFGICIIAFILVCISIHFYDNKPKPLEQLRHLAFSIPLGLAFVLIKYLYKNSFVNAFSFLFYDGILCIIFPFITISIISIFKGKEYFNDNLDGVALFFHNKDILGKFFLVVVFSFGYHLTNALTIYIFNPSLMVMTDILSPIFRWVIEVFTDKEYNEKKFVFIATFKGLGFFLIIFSAVVFNELLILYFCGFDRNIEANISKRAKNEFLENSDNGSGSFSVSKDDDEYVSTTQTFESEMASFT